MLTEQEERALRELATATAAVDRRFARRLSAGPFARRDRIRRAAVVAAAVVGAGALDTVLGSWRSGLAAAVALGLLALAAVIAVVVRSRLGDGPGTRPASTGA